MGGNGADDVALGDDAEHMHLVIGRHDGADALFRQQVRDIHQGMFGTR